MEPIEAKEKIEGKLNIVIMWFGELWQWFYDILNHTNSNVYVVSISWRNDALYTQHWVKAYNWYEWFPVSYEDIDAVLLCCRTNQLDKVSTLIPKSILPKVISKMISFQNWFGVKEKLMQLFWKSPARCIPYLSFKCYNGKDINLTFAKPSPIKSWDEASIKKIINLINDYTSDTFWMYLFEWVDSIALQRDGEYKAIINSVLNSLCVIYKWDVAKSMNKFEKEFGANWLLERSKEISCILNSRFNWIFETNPWEVKYRIENIAQKFAKEKPSTYNQYYEQANQRGKILSEDNHLLGYIIQQSRLKWIIAPISDIIRWRMKDIEKQINMNIKPFWFNQNLVS